jgi:hypothetical protein
MALVIHILALAGKAVGVSMAFLLAKIGILGSSKGARAGATMTTATSWCWVTLGLSRRERVELRESLVTAKVTSAKKAKAGQFAKTKRRAEAEKVNASEVGPAD